MKLISGTAMRQVDKTAIEEMGIPEAVLVENAGRAVARAADHMLGGQGRITVLTGKGNNGADGLAAARFLVKKGYKVTLVLAEPEASFGPGAALELRICKQFPMEILHYPAEKDQVREAVKTSSLLLDSLLGTRFHGVIREPMHTLVKECGDSGIPVLAVDIPSGIEADTGRRELSLKAAATVTMIAPKPGLYLYPGAAYTGKIILADLNTPPCLVAEAPGKEYRLDPAMIRDWLPVRPKNSHKGMNGKIGVVAGSLGYAGAAEMCSKAVVRSGGGLVSLYTRKEVLEPLIIKSTEVMVRPLDLADPDQVLAALREYDVLAVGPGMGKSPEVGECLARVLPRFDGPIVLDADGLNLLAGRDDVLSSLKQKIFTPHPGEMARLLGCPVREVLQQPLEKALEGAARWQAVVVLKCAPTVIALPDGTLYMNSTGNEGMATGGSGDVLTGTIAGFLGQKLSLQEAACCGVYIHGLAGDLAAANGKIGMQAGDLLYRLPQAIDKAKKYVPVLGASEFA